MKKIKLFTSNKTEDLVHKLISNFSATNNNLFNSEAEVIITKNQSLSEWLMLEIARSMGIAMNINCWYPNTLLTKVYQQAFPEADLNFFKSNYLIWSLLKIFCNNAQDFSIIKKYISDSSLNAAKSYQLAEKLANLFDEYQIYRPEMILKWNQGQEINSDWQYKLWQEVKKINQAPDYAELLLAFLDQELSGFTKFPKTLHVFGISFLPRYHFLLLDKLSEVVEINLYLLNPSPHEYWFDLKSEKEKLKLLTKYSKSEKDLLYFETGNSLLASLGMAGKQFFELVYSLERLYEDEPEVEATKITENIIQYIQQDLANLKDFEHKTRPLIEVEDTDDSLEIHVCHNALREVEVLKDFLLKTFTNDQTLSFEDVLVMAPDIATYAPYIEMVFQNNFESERGFNYHIADQTLLSESVLIKLFFEILSFPKTNFKLTAILSLLENDLIRAKFGFTDDSLIYLKKWFDEAKIKWGLNKEYREELGFLPYDENSWEKGLRKLIVSYALTSKNDDFFVENSIGNIPCSEIEGQLGLLLGNFLYFFDELILLLEKITKYGDLDYWQKTLRDVLAFIDVNDDYLNDLIVLRDVIDQLNLGPDSVKSITKFQEKINLEIIQYHLQHELSQKKITSHFFRGGITFSQLLPMRSIPKKIICLLGLDQNAFPRKDQSVSFSLLANNFQLGDKSIKNIDRYLFLEILLSVRKKMFISYTGFGANSQGELLPSSVVAELIEYVKYNFAFYKNDCDKKNLINTISDKIIFNEKLHGFNEAYFTKSINSLYSYSYENFELAKSIAKVAGKKALNKEIFNDLGEPSAELFNLRVNDLISFFRKPTNFLLQKRFGIYLNQEVKEVEDNELFFLEIVNKLRLFEKMVPLSVKGYSPEQIYAFLKDLDLLPPQKLGHMEFEKFLLIIEPFIKEISNFTKNQTELKLAVSFGLHKFNLTGYLSGLYNFGLLNYQFSNNKGKVLLENWLKHLILNILRPRDNKLDTVVVFRTKPPKIGIEKITLTSINKDQAEKELQDLLAIYTLGLTKPLPFFPDASFKFAENLILKSKSDFEAITLIKSSFFNKDFGEFSNPYTGYFFSEDNVLNDDFKDLAVKIYAPIFNSISS